MLSIMELKTDLNCLIECLRYRRDDAGKARDTILTIASLCSGSDEAQNFLRASGGLSFVVNLLSTAQDEGVRVATLYALGCATERNVFSQSRLCTEAMFQFLYCQLTSEHSGLQLKRTTTFLIMCLITNNGKGQVLVRKSKCLDAMLQLFRQFPGLDLPYSPDTRCSEDEEGQKLSLELWKDVAGTLCGCVNNPQNDENQLVCASSIPAALYIMSRAQDSHVLQLLCSYISLLAANNAVNQDRLHMLGGLEVIVSKLTSVIDAIVMEPERGMISSASSIISMLSSVISDNENNLQALSSLKVVPLLLKLLSLEVITQGVKSKVIITLGCLVSTNEGSKKQVVECDGLKLLLSFMMANQDEECAKAATLVLHSCINSDSAAGDREDREDESSETGRGSENEDQAEKRPLVKEQHYNLEARIDILQQALEKERRLRKSLEDEKVTLQDSKDNSNGSISRGEGKATAYIPDQLHVPHPKTTVTNAEGHKTELPVAGRSDISMQSSHSFVQLQERINTLEQKLQNITTIRSETDTSSDTTSSDSSDIESAECMHRSVSEAEDEEAKPSSVPPRKNYKKQCQTKLNPPGMNQEYTGKDTHQLQMTTSEKDQSKESPQFKVPPPVKRCRPVQLVHGNMSVNRMKYVTPRIKPLPQRKKQQEERGEVTPPTKVQKVDLVGHTSPQESLHPSVPPGTSSGKKPRARRSSRRNVNRTLTYTGVGDHSGSADQLSKDGQVNPESDSDADSESSGTSSIADSVFSSLNEHLSCPIRPIKHSLPPPFRHSPIRPTKQSSKVTMRPVRPSMHKPALERRNVKNRIKKHGKESDPDAKSNNVFDFGEDVDDCQKESSQRASSSNAFNQEILSEDLVAKLKATPKIMLKKASLKGHNMKMFTFDGKPQVKDSVHSSSGNKPGSCQGVKDPPLHQPKHQGGDGSQKVYTRIFTTKESGGKRKSYSVHYVRGKIQCSRLYRRNLSHGTSGTLDAYFSICPGCVPPQHRPLLDSRTLLQTLHAARHNLCRKHGRLVHSIAKYISNKTNLFGS